MTREDEALKAALEEALARSMASMATVVAYCKYARTQYSDQNHIATLRYVMDTLQGAFDLTEEDQNEP